MAAGAHELRHTCEHRAIIIDVLETLDREDEIGFRKQSGEITIEQVALEKPEVGQFDACKGRTQVYAADRKVTLPACEPSLMESASAADRKGAAETARALEGMEEMRHAK